MSVRMKWVAFWNYQGNKGFFALEIRRHGVMYELIQRHGEGREGQDETLILCTF